MRQRLPDELECVEQRGKDNGSRALLIVMPNRYRAIGAQRIEDAKAFRLCDVLQIDAAEARSEQADGSHDFVRIARVEAHGHCIDAAEILEQERFAFHHRQRGPRPDVAEPEHARAVGHDGNAVPPVRVFEDQIGILGDLAARFGDAGRVPDGEILQAANRAFGHDLNLALVEGVQARSLERRLLSLGEQVVNAIFGHAFCPQFFAFAARYSMASSIVRSSA